MLIRNADVYRAGPADVRVENGEITHVGALSPRPDEVSIDAAGGALIPGLHDHHLHLMAFAAARNSMRCGPPEVNDAEALAAALQRAQQSPAPGWLRGVGYHESVAGDIDRAWLDRCVPDRPVRLQHRSGRLWVVNSPGLAQIRAALDVLPHEQRPSLGDDGRLYDVDPVLHVLPDAAMPPVAVASRELARYGVTGFTDMTPRNDASTLHTFRALQQAGRLLQRVCMAGAPDLTGALTDRSLREPRGRLSIGPTKVHLSDAHLPDFQALCATIRDSHESGRGVAVHCVTEVELVFALAAFREAPGNSAVLDRIEHASVTPPALLEQIRELGITVVTQPNFVAERGDAYLADIPVAEQPWLYRCASWLRGKVPLAGGTDAPFGHADPWRAMAAAVTRRTAAGRTLGADERLTPEQALDLFLGALHAPARPRAVEAGQAADLCLLDRPWRRARHTLSSACVRGTICAGNLVYERVD